MFTKIKEAMGQYLNRPVGNFENHLKSIVTLCRFGILGPRKAECRELKDIIKIYEELVLRRDIAQNDRPLPVLFKIDWENNKALATEREISPYFYRFDRETCRGELRNIMEFFFDIVLCCIHRRLQSKEAATYTYMDGTVALFCAELAGWAKDIAKRQIDDTLCDEVKRRIDYLRAIEKSEIFRNDVKTDYSVDLLCWNLRCLLEKNAKVEIDSRLNRRSSREHFDALKRGTEDFFIYISKALFTLYTQKGVIAPMISMVNLDMINDEISKVFDTALGGAYKKLYHTYISQFAPAHNRITQGEQIISSNFYDTKGNPNSALIETFQAPDRSGIHPLMRGNPCSIVALVKALGLIEDLTYFLSGFEQAYELAGAGGDILMYIALCNEVTQIMFCYMTLKQTLLEAVNLIEEQSDAINLRLVKARQYDPWKIQHFEASRHFDDAKKRLGECDRSIKAILYGMQEVLTPEYKQKTQDLISSFRMTVMQITQRTQVHSTLPIQQTSQTRPSIAAPLSNSIQGLLRDVQTLQANHQALIGNSEQQASAFPAATDLTIRPGVDVEAFSGQH